LALTSKTLLNLRECFSTTIVYRNDNLSTLPIVFNNTHEMITFAERFIVNDRLRSLENDVNRCVPTPAAKTEPSGYAPFPALMYCFSVIDFLGALLAGNARSGNTTENSAKYMKRYLGYSDDKLRLLQRIYRHKIAHLSQPKSAMIYNGQIIAWRHDENIPSKHLGIDPVPRIIDILGLGKIHCNGEYIVSIWVLKDDIKKSVIKSPGGYLEELKKDIDLQHKFVIAVNQIYDPVITD
jgi:hypothetical protein